MKKGPVTKLIKDMHFDLDNLHEDWDRGNIDDMTMLEKMTNLCFYFLRTLVDCAIKEGGN